jgi:hypothetical protein
MWSLPDIRRMNQEAMEVGFKKQLQAQLKCRARVVCLFCDKRATKNSRQEWFDIFSDQPKGVIGLCKKHDGDLGGVPEGYFFCDACGRLFIQNYTWENYFAETDTGAIVCLNCRAKEYIEDNEHWMQLDEATIDEIDFDVVRKAPHLIAVEGPIPEGLKFYDNVEFDSYTGSPLGGGIPALKNILKQASEEYSEAILILDAAYQFAVSIGVYVRT